jgi:hypothetical protein
LATATTAATNRSEAQGKPSTEISQPKSTAEDTSLPNQRSTLRRELNLRAARLMLFGQRELHGMILPVCVGTFAETACQLLRFEICIMSNSEQEPISPKRL